MKKTKILLFHSGQERESFMKDSEDFIEIVSKDYWKKVDAATNLVSLNPNYPGNYIDAIINFIGKHEYILINGGDEVAKGLAEKNIPVNLISASRDRRDEFSDIIDEEWEKGHDLMEQFAKDHQKDRMAWLFEVEKGETSSEVISFVYDWLLTTDNDNDYKNDYDKFVEDLDEETGKGLDVRCPECNSLMIYDGLVSEQKCIYCCRCDYEKLI